MPPAREHSHAPCAQQTWKCLPVRAHGRGILRANIAAAPVRKYAGSIKTRSISRRADCRKSEKRHEITVCTNFTFFLTLSLTPGCVQYITGKKFLANHFSYSSYELLDQPGADIDGEWIQKAETIPSQTGPAGKGKQKRAESGADRFQHCFTDYAFSCRNYGQPETFNRQSPHVSFRLFW